MTQTWTRLITLTVLLAAVVTFAMPRPVEADRTARVIAGLAVGALVYKALDDSRDSRSSYAPSHYRSSDPHRRYNPPPASQHYWRYESPRDVYNDGYNDGFRDGYDVGNRDGYSRGHDTGYQRGYSDGRYDRSSSRYGPPYNRISTRQADKAYW